MGNKFMITGRGLTSEKTPVEKEQFYFYGSTVPSSLIYVTRVNPTQVYYIYVENRLYGSQSEMIEYFEDRDFVEMGVNIASANMLEHYPEWDKTQQVLKGTYDTEIESYETHEHVRTRLAEEAKAHAEYLKTREDYDKNETAKLVRRMLKESFAGIKFSVRATYATHSPAIDVKWIDGPTTKEVMDKIGVFKCASFDGMTDSTSYHDSINPWTGAAARYSCDFLDCERSYSIEKYTQIHNEVCQDWQLDPKDFPIILSKYDGSPYVNSAWDHELTKRSGQEFGTWLGRKLQETSFYTSEQPEPPESGATVGEYKGHPTLTLPLDNGKEFSFGLNKAKAILQYLDDIKAFVE